MLKGVIFDWDGVLVDSIQLTHEFLTHMCTQRGLNYPFASAEHLRKNWREPFNEFYDSMGFNWNKDHPLLREAFQAFMTKNHLPFFAGMKEILAELSSRSTKIGIASSNRSIVIRTSLQRHSIEHCVHAVLTADDVTVHKPDPAVVLHCLEKMGLSAGDVVFVGDQPSDVVAAHRAGIRSVAVTWGWADKTKLHDAKADYVVDMPDELRAVLWRL